MSENDHRRDDSFSRPWRRERRRSRWKSDEPITDQNAASFIAEAMRNGINLIAIAAAAAAAKKEEKKEK